MGHLTQNINRGRIIPNYGCGMVHILIVRNRGSKAVFDNWKDPID